MESKEKRCCHVAHSKTRHLTMVQKYDSEWLSYVIVRKPSLIAPKFMNFMHKFMNFMHKGMNFFHKILCIIYDRK